MSEEKVTRKLADAETRSLSNQARIVRLEAELTAVIACEPSATKRLAKKIKAFQNDVNRLAELFAKHGGA